MSDEQLSELLSGMAKTPLNAETVATFQSDLSRVHAEMAERGMIAEPKAAEDRIVIIQPLGGFRYRWCSWTCSWNLGKYALLQEEDGRHQC